MTSQDREHKVLHEVYQSSKKIIHDSQKSVLDHFKSDSHDWEATIDMSSYKHEVNRESSKNINRFALYKIQQINPHFFNDEENRVLNAANPGVFSYALWAATATPLTCLAFYGVTNKMFMKKNFLIFSAGLLGLSYCINRIPNMGNELCQNYNRRIVANKYLEAWGQDFMNQIVDPRYSVEKIKHLENPIHKHH